MRPFLKPLQRLYAVYAIVVFVALMIPVFIWSLLVLAAGRIRGGNLIYYGCIVWADVWFALIFIWHKNVYVQKPRPHQPYIFVANHISYLDSACVPKTFRRPLRPLGKVEVAKVPVFGTIYKNIVVSVDRSSPEHRARSVQTLKSILQKEISVLVFPEGTFNTTGQPLKDFYDGAFRIAIETGTPVMPVLLLHTFDRMHTDSVLSLNPGRSRSVFLPEIPVAGLTAADVPALKAKVFGIMSRELRKARAGWIREQAV